MSQFLSQLIGGGADGSTLLLALAIIIGIFFLEDTTIVVVGVLASDGIIGIPLALVSLYIGVILSDTLLYFLGHFASTHPKLAKHMDHDLVRTSRTWLEKRFLLTVFSARFIPGSRIPAYTASGLFRFPFPTFIITTVAATAIWTTSLFVISYWFGSLTTGWFGHLRWGLAGAFLIALLFIGRHNFRAYKARKDNSNPSIDIPTP